MIFVNAIKRIARDQCLQEGLDRCFSLLLRRLAEDAQSPSVCAQVDTESGADSIYWTQRVSN